jgi:transposase
MIAGLELEKPYDEQRYDRLDIAKSVFQVHGVDAAGEVVIQRKLTRERRVLAFFERLQRCLVGIEACSSSHYWARELRARGHDVRLLPAQGIIGYVIEMLMLCWSSG